MKVVPENVLTPQELCKQLQVRLACVLDFHLLDFLTLKHRSKDSGCGTFAFR